MLEVVFEGVKFRNYATNRYLQSAKKVYGEKYLHRVIWARRNGKIPHGFQIHHIDEDYLNNNISNLQMMSISEHSREHGLKAVHLKSQERLELLDRIRPLSHEWHKTSEASAILSAAALSKPLIKKTCKNCGTEYETRNVKQSMYCGQRCGKRYRRKQTEAAKEKT